MALTVGNPLVQLQPSLTAPTPGAEQAAAKPGTVDTFERGKPPQAKVRVANAEERINKCFRERLTSTMDGAAIRALLGICQSLSQDALSKPGI